MSASPRTQRECGNVQDLPAPRGLEAHTLETDEGEFLVLSYELPATVLPAILSLAEREILLTVTMGRSNEQIAAARKTSPRTVANQLQAIFRKLGVSSRAELLVAIARGTGVGRAAGTE